MILEQQLLIGQEEIEEQPEIVEGRIVDTFIINDLPIDFDSEGNSNIEWFQQSHPLHEPSSPASPPEPLLTPSPVTRRSSAAVIPLESKRPLRIKTCSNSQEGNFLSPNSKKTLLHENGTEKSCRESPRGSKISINSPLSQYSPTQHCSEQKYLRGEAKISSKDFPKSPLVLNDISSKVPSDSSPSPPKLHIDIALDEPLEDPKRPRRIGGGKGASRVVLSTAAATHELIKPTNDPPLVSSSHVESPLLKRIRVASRFTPVPAELPDLICSLSRRASPQPHAAATKIRSRAAFSKDRPVRMEELRQLLDEHNKRVRKSRR